MMELHGTIVSGAMSYEAGMLIMNTITPIVRSLIVVAILALTTGALIAQRAHPDDELR